MIAKEEIKAWLDVPDQEKDFQKGLDLLTKYSRNRCVINQVERKKNLPLLVYQVAKIIGVHLLPAGSPDIQVRELHVVKKDGATSDKKDGKTDSTSDLLGEIETKFGKIDRKTLPENLQLIHDHISEAYKFQRTYHEKMKLAETDMQRGELRAMVIEYDDIIAKGWNAIDTFLKEGNAPAATSEKTTLDISRDINAARSYITKNLNALATLPEKKKVSRISEIKKRVDVLITLKAPVKKETFNALLQSGIISEASGLVIETR